MAEIDLRADCARCAALCCMSLAFDKGPRFAADKPAVEACPHLAGDGCTIHRDRAALGYAGCVAFDCQGAGPRVTQHLFQGRDWRNDAALRGPMTEAFVALLRAHEVLALLDQARTLPLSADDLDRLTAVEADLYAAGADARRIAELSAQAHAFLRTLRRYVQASAALG